MGIGPITGAASGVFSKAKDFFMSKPKEARMLAVAGAGNFVLGGGGFMSKILDLAGIACLFVPVLMPFIAAAYLIRGAWQLVKGVFCLLKGDFKGFLGNLAAGALNIVCALPFGRVGKAVEAFKKASTPSFVGLSPRALGNKSISEVASSIPLNYCRFRKGMNAAIKELYGKPIAQKFSSTVSKAVRLRKKFGNGNVGKFVKDTVQKAKDAVQT